MDITITIDNKTARLLQQHFHDLTERQAITTLLGRDLASLEHLSKVTAQSRTCSKCGQTAWAHTDYEDMSIRRPGRTCPQCGKRLNKKDDAFRSSKA